MRFDSPGWERGFEITWRILVFLVALGILVVVFTNWNRWDGAEGCQRTNSDT
jgi:hypothetical protein